MAQLDLSRATITPNARGDVVDVHYSVNRLSRVSLTLQELNGVSHSLRSAELRRANEGYVYQFNGTAPAAPESAERRVLPDGSYELILDALADNGQAEQLRRTITVDGADLELPRIEQTAVFPETISPNFDGVDDVATITFRLTKRARVQQFADDRDGNPVFVTAAELLEPGEYVQRWDGTAKERPVGDGAYSYRVRATDAAGNVVESSVPLRVSASGQPEGRVVRVDFTPQQLMVGGILNIRALIRNTGTLPLRTAGPEPGYTYSTFDSFGSISNHLYIDRLGNWRLGVDWAGSPTSTGSKYPYRWGFGRDLNPGEEIEVLGALRIEHGPALDRQIGALNNRIFVYAGLIHEGVAFHDDRVGGTWIEIGY
jgi:hypothetical protein